MRVRTGMTVGALLLLVCSCPAARDAGSAPADEETIWRTWLVSQGVLPRRMAVSDTTAVRTFLGDDLSFEGAFEFAEREAKCPERGEKATREAMAELRRRLEALAAVPRNVASSALAGPAAAVLPAEQYRRLNKTCETCGWAPFRAAHPGFDGAFSLSRVGFFRSFAMFYAEESTCGSARGSLVLLKFIDNRWAVAGSASGSIACGDCPESSPAVPTQ